MITRSLRTLAAVATVVATVGLTGCSGGEAAAPSTSAPSTETSPSSVAASPTTTASTTTVPDYAEWCTAAERIEATDDFLDAEIIVDPDAVEMGITTWLDQLIAARPLAPADIEDDVQTTIDVITSLDEAFARSDYQVLDVDFGSIEGLTTEMPTAAENIEAFNLVECGIVADDEPGVMTPGEGDPAFDPSAGSVRDQVVARFVAQGFTEDEADCLVDQIDLVPAESATSTVAPAEVFAACGITEERLLELGG